jgi:hypothetical protein
MSTVTSSILVQYRIKCTVIPDYLHSDHSHTTIFFYINVEMCELCMAFNFFPCYTVALEGVEIGLVLGGSTKGTIELCLFSVL